MKTNTIYVLVIVSAWAISTAGFIATRWWGWVVGHTCLCAGLLIGQRLTFRIQDEWRAAARAELDRKQGLN